MRNRNVVAPASATYARASRSGVIALVAFAALCVGGCSSDDGATGAPSGDATRAPVTPPASVPAGADFVGADLSVGATTGDGGSDDERLLLTIGCNANVLTVTTTRETVYAELSCDRAVPDEVAERFLNTPVRITIRPSQSKLFVESPTGGSIEFTTGGAWIEAR